MDTELDDTPHAAIAVAASAGGVEALTGFVRSLPADLPAVVLVVLHVSDTGPSVLPGVLGRACALGVAHAEPSERLCRGKVLVAPPGHHLRVHDGFAHLDRGPRENGHRPSADALLRSVASSWASRAAGVVLSGTMDDGAAGLQAIGAAGGLTIVQDPSEAAFPGMPHAAIAEAHPAVVCKVETMGDHLSGWIEAFGDGPEAPVPPADRMPGSPQAEHDPTEFTCPGCGGSLRLDASYGTECYRCRVGHVFTPDGLLRGKQHALEAALWAAVVALEEQAEVARRIVARLERIRRPTRHYRQDIARTGERIELLRVLIDGLGQHGTADVSSEHEERNGTESTR